jgi:HEPN domain-containing protein
MSRKPEPLTKEAKTSLVNYWILGSQQDLESCEAIFVQAKRYGAALFFLHLSIEKILKALYVAKTNQHAPLTHNLLALAEAAGLESTGEIELALATINEFNMVTRYPSQKSDFYGTATFSFAKSHIDRGKEIYQWINQTLQLLQ